MFNEEPVQARILAVERHVVNRTKNNLCHSDLFVTRL